MATLVLTIVGNIVGGPIGGAIGAAIGQQIDSRLFAPKARHGPRLADLAVQSSRYGAQLPRLHGRTRVTGSVIWATDLQEQRTSQSGGKGQPKQVGYAYTSSFAVALSARRVGRIGRIWADGKLLRGAAGDFKVATGFRFYAGDEGQPVDPLIAAVEGAGSAPAYRGLAYAVFENMELATFGNRIPSLGFEVIADEAPISIGSILHDAVGGVVVVDCPTQVDGLAVQGSSLRGLAETLATLVPLHVTSNGGGTRFSEEASSGPALDAADFGAAGVGGRMPARLRERQAVTSQPVVNALVYHDVSRDYQIGLQRARIVRPSRRAEASEFAGSLTPERARALIERQILTAANRRDEMTLTLPWRWLALAPGQRVRVPGETGQWTIAAAHLEAMIVKLTLVREPPILPSNLMADPGRAVAEVDALPGETRLALLDLPGLSDAVVDVPQVFIAACGTQPGWRRAALLRSINGGAHWEDAGPTAAAATMGVALTVLPPGAVHIADRLNALDVSLLHGGMALNNATPDAVLAGANIAMLGGELLQFERAVPLGGTLWRLSGLLRGRRGTESAISQHGVGDPFVLIEAAMLQPIAVAVGTASLSILATGLGDSDPVLATTTSPGLALRPLRPAHLGAQVQPNADVRIAWVRRSRTGWAWLDGVDASLAEETEHYAVTITPNSGPLRSFSRPTPDWIYTRAAQEADIGLGATSVTVSVAQIGRYAASLPASITLSL